MPSTSPPPQSPSPPQSPAPTQSPAPGPAPAAITGLSPSRAADFMNCPLLYRLRSVDRLPERPTAAATRGTLVHAVLERLFELPPGQRTPDAAVAMLDPAWGELLAGRPELAELFDGDEASLRGWLASAAELLGGYFELEDPRRLAPAALEAYVEADLGDGLLLRGYVDRLDASAAGELRVVDYKTGRAPGESFEAKALFQLKFYALVLWRSRGTVPRELRLLYLGDREMLRYSPGEDELRGFERTLRALWAAIGRAQLSGDWRPNPGKLCGFCEHRGVHCTAHPADAERAAAYDAWRQRWFPDGASRPRESVTRGAAR